MKTIVGMFDDLGEAHRAVDELANLGVGRREISVITQEPNGRGTANPATENRGSRAADGAGVGAGTGAVVGGVAGILASLGLIAIPGIGGLLALGPIVALLSGAGIGAAAGGIIGGLIGLGIPEEDAEEYAEGIRRGGTVVTARVDDNAAQSATAVFERHHAVDMNQRREQWRQAGWQPRRGATTAARTAGTGSTGMGSAGGRPAGATQPATPRPVSTGGRSEPSMQNPGTGAGRREASATCVRVYTRQVP